jgi:hypothetical protein
MMVLLDGVVCFPQRIYSVANVSSPGVSGQRWPTSVMHGTRRWILLIPEVEACSKTVSCSTKDAN